jgi:hypothetical protein
MNFVAGFLKIILGVFVGAALVGLFNINFRILHSGVMSTNTDMTYADLAAVNLTAATVALGAVAVVVTIAAVFGFQVIRAASVSAAESRVEGDLPKLLEIELGRMERDGRLTHALERALYSGREPNGDNGDPVEG